jgi:hypothetical protein
VPSPNCVSAGRLAIAHASCRWPCNIEIRSCQNGKPALLLCPGNNSRWICGQIGIHRAVDGLCPRRSPRRRSLGTGDSPGQPSGTARAGKEKESGRLARIRAGALARADKLDRQEPGSSADHVASRPAFFRAGDCGRAFGPWPSPRGRFQTIACSGVRDGLLERPVEALGRGRVTPNCRMSAEVVV